MIAAFVGCGIGLVNTHTGEVEYHPVCASPERLLSQELTAVDSENYACPPQSEFKNKTRSVDQGQNLKMECGITGDPSPELHWLLPDHSSITPGTNQGPLIVDDDCTLTIIRIQDNDDGTYSCVGSNLAGQVSVPNYVTVKLTGIGRPTTTTIATINDNIVPLAQSSSAPVVPIVCAVVGVLVLLVIIALFVMRRRNKRKMLHGPETNFVFHNEPVASNCDDTCANGIQRIRCPSNEVRYADSLPGAPVPPLMEPPPPYTTLPPDQPTYEQIYDRIQDNAYETPIRLGESMTLESCPSLTHTYMTQVQRQDSQISQKSCGAPAGYDRFVIRPAQGNLYTSGVACATPGANNTFTNRASNSDNPQKEKTLPSDAGIGTMSLDNTNKVTYQNTRRE